MPNQVLMGGRILTSGQPTRAQLLGLRARGIDTVMHLAVPTARSSVDDEMQVVRRQGLAYLRLDVDPDHLTTIDFRRVSRALAESGDRHVLVHCDRNALASTFVFLYRVIELGEDMGWALADLEQATAVRGPLRQFIETQLALNGSASLDGERAGR